MSGGCVLICGASGGLGASLARRFLSAGWMVYAGMLQGEMERWQERPVPGLFPLVLDVTCEEHCRATTHEVTQKQGALDVLINCAGILCGGGVGEDPLTAIDLAALTRSVDVNAFGIVRLVKHLLPALQASGNPIIINITSEAGSLREALGCYDPYNLSKTMQNIITLKIRERLRERVRVLAVHPGRMRTGMSGGAGDIDPDESAEGIWTLCTAASMEKSDAFFVDYRGRPMVF